MKYGRHLTEELTPVLLLVASDPTNISDGVVATIERFTILLYDRTSHSKNIDETRLDMFTRKGRAMNAIPPTKAALLQHIKRAVYQGGHC